jgi:hypothetical protein
MDCRAESSLRWGDWEIGGLGVRKAFLDPMPRKICELRAANLLRSGAWLQAGYHLLRFLELLLKRDICK